MSDMKVADPTSALAQPEVEGSDKPFWPVAAALLAAGFGVLVLGFLTTLAEASSAAKDWLTFKKAVGPLSGKTLVSVGAWLISWIVLAVGLRGKEISQRTVYWLTGVMVALGLLGTLPTFFDKFAKD